MEKIYVTAKGLEALNAKLQSASQGLTAIREEKSIAYTASGDTWHDNPSFNRLEQDEKRKAEEVAEIGQLIANAELFTADKRNVVNVALGSIVRIARTYMSSGDSDELTFEIGGYGETDMSKKTVAYNAPMAAALMGLRVGEIAQSQGPRGLVEYEILALLLSVDSL